MTADDLALWTAVDAYFDDALIGGDAALEATIAATAAAGMPMIAVSPSQGKLLALLCQTVSARRVLEIGTLGGYSTIWMARALAPGGEVVTIEAAPTHAEVARRNIAAAGLANRVDIRIGAGLSVLPLIASEAGGPFDLSFIDADKANIPGYFDWAVKLSRPGSLIVVDNVTRKGAILRSDSGIADVEGVRKFRDTLATDTRVSATAIQTVGVKGYDGFILARVN
ncbi:MAG: O-methyltransferase [Bauldia sp.]|nr:O-methyltransferase [Bauldia sp.]